MSRRLCSNHHRFISVALSLVAGTALYACASQGTSSSQDTGDNSPSTSDGTTGSSTSGSGGSAQTTTGSGGSSVGGAGQGGAIGHGGATTSSAGGGGGAGTGGSQPTCDGVPLADNQYEIDGVMYTSANNITITAGTQWQLSGGDDMGHDLGVQFRGHPSTTMVYEVQDFTLVVDPTQACINLSLTTNMVNTMSPGIAGGCMRVTVTNGKATISFNNLMTQNNHTVSATLVEP